MAARHRLTGLVALAAVALAAPSLAQDKAAGPFGGFKHDSKAPIEITANSLEVRQAQNLAIFTGDVVAGQGTLRLTTDRLDVTYVDQGDSGNVSTGKIQKMRAEGNVFLSNGSETAQGQWAEYNVADGKMNMGGNVVLTQGDNAVSGQALVIDLNTGVGRVESAGTGRVKSVFTPAPAKN